MQVMTGIHSDKYENFGGKLAAFDPVTNLRVGAKVLQECIQRAGSVEAGLKYYVGAALHPDDGGYGAKVLAEYGRLKEVATGRAVPLFTPPTVRTVAPVEPVPAPGTEPAPAV
jgi:soluble lytic murein transglycosylase-like protein